MARPISDLHAMTTPEPRLAHVEGMAVVLCGDSTVVFDREADARFYVEAHREVPALLARLRELESQVFGLGQGALEIRNRELGQEIQRRIVVEMQLRDTEARLEKEVALRTAAASAARIGLAARAREAELLRRIATLNNELENERNKRSR